MVEGHCRGEFGRLPKSGQPLVETALLIEKDAERAVSNGVIRVVLYRMSSFLGRSW